ncbi:double zinc ribbon domain-containing protein [Spongiibacter nanhainus]
MVNSSLNRLIYKLFPGRCVLCMASSRRHLDLCADCERSLPWLERQCRRCALPLDGDDGAMCGQCLTTPPHFQRCLCPLRYDFPVDRLITGLKHHGRLPYSRVLSQLWLQQLEDRALASAPDLILPVPLHWRRQLFRGFNQSRFIAEDLARALDIPLIDPLRRRRATPPQQGLSAAQRRRNLRRAFIAKADAELSARHIALVDDVVTTGSTANTLAKLLLDCGARRVDVWCLARTP